ncbi:hypothetical protein FE257_002690 [Aspergillus nanangensis]|uniref:Uncharacterized protein n=1 Tax=Aspergillus nanangensis TaxID=2582783 RepID=A0AAD4CCG8_ASPNN|nr:hypothetical protein FE257_002690 [Aspergillus nanangensis]
MKLIFALSTLTVLITAAVGQPLDADVRFRFVWSEEAGFDDAYYVAIDGCNTFDSTREVRNVTTISVRSWDKERPVECDFYPDSGCSGDEFVRLQDASRYFEEDEGNGGYSVHSWECRE